MASPPFPTEPPWPGIWASFPGADTAPVLLVLDASVKMESVRGERSNPLSEFFPGPQQTARRPDEILTGVILPIQEDSSAFLKLGRRKVEERGEKKTFV